MKPFILMHKDKEKLKRSYIAALNSVLIGNY